MANNRTANSAYYASKTPLVLRSTKEGRGNPKRAPSYRHKAGSQSGSSDKYYAEMKTPDTDKSKPQQVKASKRVEVAVSDQTLAAIVSAFQSGATSVVVTGASSELLRARTLVDLAVGQQTLTREQVNDIVFIAKEPEPPQEVELNESAEQEELNQKVEGSTVLSEEEQHEEDEKFLRAVEENTDTEPEKADDFDDDDLSAAFDFSNLDSDD